MNKHTEQCYSTQRGITLVELMITVTIVGLLVLISGVGFRSDVERINTRACAEKIASDIELASTSAQVEGQRVALQIAATQATDLDGDGLDEYFLTYVDLNRNAVMDGGDVALTHGLPEDTLCDPAIIIDPYSDLNSDTLVFNTLGTISVGGRAAAENLYLTQGNEVARLSMLSLTGLTRVYLRNPDDDLWNSATCDDGGSYITDYAANCWVEVNR